MNNQNKDDEEFIGSLSPTIDIVTQRKLAELQKINGMLTKNEATLIMKTYLLALNRIMKENGKDF